MVNVVKRSIRILKMRPSCLISFITLQNLSSCISKPFLQWAVLRVGGGRRSHLRDRITG